MWIRQLDVTDCAGIKAASVSLQPGLNVLHGPNELGKSTLVKAIRATLLLPPGGSMPQRRMFCKEPSTSRPWLSCANSCPSREKSR